MCVVTPHRAAVSETFIDNHIRRLPGRVSVLHGGTLPTLTGDARPLLSRPLHVAFVGRARLPRHLRGLLERRMHLAIRGFLRRHEIDVVLAEYGPTGAAVAPICQSAGVPLVVHFHGFDAYHQPTLADNAATYPRLFAVARAVVAVSRDMRRQLLRLGARPDTLFLNPYGVDVTFFDGADPASAPPVFVSVGRFVDKKAPHLTALAFRRVLDVCPEARLVMIGDGELREACRQLARALRMSHAVQLPGVRGPADIAASLRSARAFVQHSVTPHDGDREGAPVSILEAGASGLPVVSTRHGGIPDLIIEGRTGYLVDEADVRGMAEAMIALARDADLAGRLGRQAREHVRVNFSHERSIDRLWRIILGAIDGVSAPPAEAGP